MDAKKVKWIMIPMGGVVSLIGALTLILPIPVGLPLLAFGLAILFRYSRVVRHLLLKQARKHQSVKALIRKVRKYERRIFKSSDSDGRNREIK